MQFLANRQEYLEENIFNNICFSNPIYLREWRHTYKGRCCPTHLTSVTRQILQMMLIPRQLFHKSTVYEYSILFLAIFLKKTTGALVCHI